MATRSRTAAFFASYRRMLLVIAATLAAPACAAGVRGGFVYGYPVVEPAYVPAHIHYYPRAPYRGRSAYLVGGSWYYPTQRGWVVFREEPRELRPFRGRPAPAIRHAPAPRYGAPRAYPRERYAPRPSIRPSPRSPEFAAPPRERRRYHVPR